jgi:hypothetical protein
MNDYSETFYAQPLQERLRWLRNILDLNAEWGPATDQRYNDLMDELITALDEDRYTIVDVERAAYLENLIKQFEVLNALNRAEWTLSEEGDLERAVELADEKLDEIVTLCAKGAITFKNKEE